MSTTNLEEAATVAAEYISSLENLPAEVQHLLAEMRHKDMRAHELQSEITKESAKYIRHSLRTSANQTLSAKDSAIPQTVQAQYAEIDKLSLEKEKLAERIVQLVARARAKLDHDLNRVFMLQGEPELAPQPTFSLSSTTKNPVAQLNESLRGVISIQESPATPTSTGPPPQKKRRITAQATAGSIKLPSPAPVSVPSSVSVGQKSRLNQTHARNSPSARGRRVTASVGPDIDDEGEGDEDLEEDVTEGGDTEDKEEYCFCRKLSYGEMIGCDNPECRYQWFHLACVNVKPPLPDRWYCSDCQQLLGSALTSGPERRKGRKK